MRVTYRAPVFSADGVVATPHYLASLAGADALRDGGSAVDAAIASNLVLCVVWPHMCGVGGDLFAQVWSPRDERLFGLNASGRAGAAMSLAAYRARGLQAMPPRGPLSVTVPGAVSGWFALHARWGRLDPGRLFRDAIHYARDGFLISRIVSAAIRANVELLSSLGGAAEIFLVEGGAPDIGDRLVQPDLAHTLERLAADGPGAMYGGWLGERLAGCLGEHGGLLTLDDLRDHRADWVEPIQTDYGGARVCELPPNTQGITLLQMLNMLAPGEVAGWHIGNPKLVHQLVERKKLAFADRDAYVADPSQVEVPVEQLLDPVYARERARQVGPQASDRAPGGPPVDGDTIYLCAADRDGMVVSLIQSLFSAWGSGVLVPGTGVTLQNRGYAFRLLDEHPNVLAPGKRPLHTLMPGLALRDDKPWLAFGTRGADGQPQTCLQILTNLLDFGLDPQAALEAPRWVHGAPGGRFPRDALVLEAAFGQPLADALSARGHQVLLTEPLDLVMGTAQLIQVDQARGCYIGASDPRGDGVALAV